MGQNFSTDAELSPPKNGERTEQIAKMIAGYIVSKDNEILKMVAKRVVQQKRKNAPRITNGNGQANAGNEANQENCDEKVDALDIAITEATQAQGGESDVVALTIAKEIERQMSELYAKERNSWFTNGEAENWATVKTREEQGKVIKVEAEKITTKHSQGKMTHALNLLSSFNSMKLDNLVCDFEIRVGDKSFAVHRAVLFAMSKYFASLISSNTEEVQEGFIVIKDISAEGVECCIEYIYTGEVELDTSNIRSVLEASQLIQLEGLVEICLQFLRDGLSVNTCLSSAELFYLYGKDTDRTKVDDFIICHFVAIIHTDAFRQVSKQNLTRYLRNHDLDESVHWVAIKIWMEGNEHENGEFLTELVKDFLELRKPPVKDIVRDVFKQHLVQENKNIEALFIDKVSNNQDALEKDLDVDISFLLKSLNQAHDHVIGQKLAKAVDEDLASHFDQAIERDEFYDLSQECLMNILGAENLRCTSEKSKWEAVMKWVKRDEASREIHLPVLMKMIRYENIPREYIMLHIRKETLVAKSERCKEILLDAVLSTA